MFKFKWKDTCRILIGSAAVFGSSGALAKDALVATVPASAAYVFEENGNPLAVGTYAVGTLKVYMIVVGTQWPATLGPLTLDLAVRAGDSKPDTNYEVPIRLRPVGGDLTLNPVPATHDVTGVGWENSSSIEIAVPDDIRNDPEMNVDGMEIVGNLQLEPTTTRTHLDTVTTLRIFAKLVHPGDTCLKHATFVANTPLSRNLSSSDDGLNVDYYYTRSGPSSNYNYTFNWTVDPSNTQIRDNVLIVNTCETQQTYDAKIGLATGFLASSPGNVVESVVSQVANAANLPLTAPYDELKAAILADDYGNPVSFVAEGTNLCVQTNTLAGLHSQWLRAKVELDTTGFTSPAGIPAAGSTFATFTSDLYENASACATAHSFAEGQATAVVYVESKTCTASTTPFRACTLPE